MDEQSGESQNEDVMCEGIGESEMEELAPEWGWPLVLVRHVTLWPWHLNLDNGHALWSRDQYYHQVWRSYPFLTLWVMTFPIGHHKRCVWSHCACAVSRDWCVRGKFSPHIWNPWPLFVYLLCDLYGSTIKIKWVICQNSVRPCVREATIMSAHAPNHVTWQ